MKQKTWVLAGISFAAAGVATGVAVAPSGAKQAVPSPQSQAANTAKVKTGELSATVSLAGILTYQAQPDGSPYSVLNQTQGIYTKLPQVGQVISQGHALYRVDDSPVVLLHGSTPAYRTLSAGAAGTDVAQLNTDLVALGYATSTELAPSVASFGPVTTAALERFQAALGLPQNGVLALGQAVFEPTAVRVTSLSTQLGGSAETGQTVLQATSTTRQVQVALDAAQQTDMADGDKVSITLPDNQTTPGIVSSVGTVATCPPTAGPGGSSTTSAGSGSDTCSAGSSGSTTPTISVVVTPSDPAATGTWDQAPVRVSITTASVSNAVAVPVTALLAQSGGGYAVEVIAPGGSRHLVPVSLGLFDDADGLVQVTDSELATGQEVVVPAI